MFNDGDIITKVWMLLDIIHKAIEIAESTGGRTAAAPARGKAMRRRPRRRSRGPPGGRREDCMPAVSA